MQLMKLIILLCLVIQTFSKKEPTEGVTDDGSDVVNSTEPNISSTQDVSEEKTEANNVTDGDIILTEDPLILSNATENGTTSNEEISTTGLEVNTTSDVTTPETTWKACALNPCKNGGTCVEDSTNSESFSCDCPSSYIGTRCETLDECNDTCKWGVCAYTEDGLKRYCKCYTGIFWDDQKKKCREPDYPCFPNPCENGGECLDEDYSYKCKCPSGYEGTKCRIRNKCGSGDKCYKGTCVMNEERNLKYCKCDSNFYWNEELERCEAVVAPCIPNPCKNSGICEPLPTGDFNCTCSEDYSGSTCETRDYCHSDEDCENGVCSLSKIMDAKMCHCNNGYYLDKELQACKEIAKPCHPNPCFNEGICVPTTPDGFNCTCSDGYLGPNCAVSDFCVLDGGNRYCGEAKCRNDQSHDVYYCVCPEGQYFDYAQRVCREVDLCPLMECGLNEVCRHSECVCEENYVWNNDTRKCESDFCSSNPCPVDGMVCEQGEEVDGYHCSCKEGYAFDGTQCKRAQCIFPSLNTCDQVCKASDNGYFCSCHSENFELKEDNSTCLYTGNTTCNNKTCENGVCIKRNDVEICICPPGYSEVDGDCVDACSSGDFPSGYCPGDKCEASTSAGFKCICEGKFALSEDKVTCSIRKVCDKTEIGYHACSSVNAKCVEDWFEADGFRCECGFGQERIGQGPCQDVCSIEENEKICVSKGGLCDVGKTGKALCKCPPFFQVDERGISCSKPAKFSYLAVLPLDLKTYQIGKKKRSVETETLIDYNKVKNDVLLTMRQLFAEFLQANILICRIKNDYLLCKMELQFLEAMNKDLNRLENENQCVTSSEHESNSCLLSSILVLRKDKLRSDVVITDTNPCDRDIKEDLCGSETTCVSSSTNKSFQCACKAGFTPRTKVYPFDDTESFIEVCKDTDECTESNPCPKNTQCTNTIGSYRCACLPGFRVQDPSDPKQEDCIEQCNPNPCIHGHCTESGNHGFECRCDAGYSGALCNSEDANFKRARTSTIVVGAVLGGILLITFILFVATISKLRKKKFADDPNNILYNSAEMTERRSGEEGAINNAYQRD